MVYILSFWDSSSRDSGVHVFLYNSPASLKTDFSSIKILTRNEDELKDQFVNDLASADVFSRFFFSHERPGQYIYPLGCCLENKIGWPSAPVLPPLQLWRPSEPFACQSWSRENLEASSSGGWESRANRSPFPSPLSEPVAASSHNPDHSDISHAFPLEATWLGPIPLSRLSSNDRFNVWWLWLSWC